MGDNGGWGKSSGLLPNGLLPRGAAGVTRALDGERWAVAEERTAELIGRIQPNQLSEERRNAVANYVQRLIMKCFSCQVFTFGSVPLKTYLPDGDIDLTTFSKNEELKDSWANEVRAILENEEKSDTAEFNVKEVQYIQAEVKIIKCLVENIVVDISFNQVGGLCTLCFLEEIDHLINQNHLFKRSIILIKAWCYYESRILGAHHGLISTYALETLVLYIFHVFNNSFKGPLEVLYRFLEFFNNFDWDNFCLSLWGPVPISSLPDITAHPPRKDGGELLLSKLFLNACSTIYAVFPGGQENQGQPFVSKHFNVIDPLRTNNNLGRSVSKGNFFRIRGAFALGAKKLARLLECPRENLIAEVNQFFVSTWERHGSGHRPDVPALSLNFRPSNTDLVEEANNSRNSASIKKKSNSMGFTAGQEYDVEPSTAIQGSTSQLPNAISQHSESIDSIIDTPAVPFLPSQKKHEFQNSPRVSEYGKNNSSCISSSIDKNKTNLQLDLSASNQDCQVRSQFARTQSSPELTDTSGDHLSKVNLSRITNTIKEQIALPRSDYSSRKNYLGSEISSSSAVPSMNDSAYGQPSQVFEAYAGAHRPSNTHLDSDGYINRGEDLNSVSELLEKQKEMNQEQNFMNMMSSSRISNFNGHFPMHMAPPHLPFTMSPFVASINYAQRNMAGIVPTNVPVIDPSWGSNMHFPQGFISSPLHQYFPFSNHNASSDDQLESGTEGSDMTDFNSDERAQKFWHENDNGSNRGLDVGNGSYQASHPDDQQQVISGSYGFIPSSQVINPGFAVRGQHKFPRESRVPVRDDVVKYQSTRPNDSYSIEKNENSRLLHASQASSSINKSGPDSSKGGSETKLPKSVRDRKKTLSTMVMTSLYGRQKGGWQFENSSDHALPQDEDEDGREWVPLTTMDNDTAERSMSVEPLHSTRSHQIPDCEQTSVSGSDSLIPVSQMVVGVSHQRAVDNPTVVPVTFYPTGPPVPFFAMVPVYNFPHETGNSDASSTKSDRDEGVDHSHTLHSNQNFDSIEYINHTKDHKGSDTSICNDSEATEGHKPDILNGNFNSHWHNLQYGRFCQNPHSHGPLTYTTPFMVPPMYVQGHYPIEGPGRPLMTNVNVFAHLMNYGNRMAPIAPLQPSPIRPGVFHRYGEELPRFRPGTGTYLPNPKSSYRERQSSNSRNHRGNYTYDRSENSDREGSWVPSRPRSSGRNHGRNQVDRMTSRLDRLPIAESRSDRMLNGFRHDPNLSYQSHNSTFGSTNPTSTSANMQYGIYQHPAMSSNGASPTGPAVPSVVMLYPYNQGSGYGAPADSLEFGTFGPGHLSGANDGPRHNDGNAVRVVEPRHFVHHRTSRSSPDRPSSPHTQRSMAEREYQLEEEDFPPLFRDKAK